MSRASGGPDPRMRMRPRRTRQILAACLAAGLFLAEASVRLTAQGVYQDELHQAADSFSWVGRPSHHYSEMSVGGLPLLNMSYSGAIKTALYGMFLRVSGSEFSVSSWRLAGILFVASALFLFFVLTALRLPGLSLFLFGALLLSDPSVLLLVRHDYGPVALSLAIRILFCAVWVRSTEEPRPGHAFLLGLLSGIAVFEKLSAVVLFFPLALALAAERRGRRRSWLVSGGAGLAVGLIPLALANGISWARERSLISLADVEQVRRTAAGFARYLWEYFSLGAGRTAREFVLGESPPIWAVLAEGALMLALVATILANARGGQPPGRWHRLAVLSAASYLLCALSVGLLPAGTEAHHWILGTPFQYVSIAAFTAEPLSGRARAPRRAGILAGVLVSLLLIVRGADLFQVERSLLAGRHSDRFDPSFTELGLFAKRSPPDTAFIVGDWGVGAAIQCLGNGRPGLLYEPFWDYRGNDDLSSILSRCSTRVFYLVTRRPLSNVRPNNTRRLLEDISRRSDLRESPVEPTLLRLHAVEVRRFVRAPGTTCGRGLVSPAVAQWPR